MNNDELLFMVMNYILVFIAGWIIGSFLNACIHRVSGVAPVTGPCPRSTSCGAGRGLIGLIAVLCRPFCKNERSNSGERVSSRHVIVELITASVLLLLFVKYSFSADFIALSYLMCILIVVFFVDMSHRIIPNGAVLAGLAGSVPVIVYNAFSPLKIYGDDKWWTPLIGILPGSGFLFLIALAGILIYGTDDAMGMGDVKIFAPIGLFLGWRMCISALLISVVLAGVSSLIMIALKLKKRKDTVPFGPYIVAGTFITIMWGADMIRQYFQNA